MSTKTEILCKFRNNRNSTDELPDYHKENSLLSLSNGKSQNTKLMISKSPVYEEERHFLDRLSFTRIVVPRIDP